MNKLQDQIVFIYGSYKATGHCYIPAVRRLSKYNTEESIAEAEALDADFAKELTKEMNSLF